MTGAAGEQTCYVPSTRRDLTKASLLFALLVARCPQALAHPGPELPRVTCHVEGFTDDGKYAVFRKEAVSGDEPCRDVSLVVHELSSTRQVATATILRLGAGCEKPISKEAGLRERNRLLTKYGAFVPRTRLERGQTGLSGEGLRLNLDVKGSYPKLDPNNPPSNATQRARLHLRLVLERGGERVPLLDKVLVVAPVRAPGSDFYIWQKPELTEGQLSADGARLALVLDEKPLLISVPRRR